jgi:hypothetical protein
MFFRTDDLRLQINTWKKQSVLDAIDILYQCERDCKSTNFPAQEILSYTIMRLAGAVRKLISNLS